MHSLSLASPSPPAELVTTSVLQNDVDMCDTSCSEAPAPQSEARTSTFVPRQVKHSHIIRNSLNSTAPFRSSPLVHSQRCYSSSSSSHAHFSGDYEIRSSQSSSSGGSSPMKSHADLYQERPSGSRSSSCSSSSNHDRTSRLYHSNPISDSDPPAPPAPPRSAARTPSPCPLPRSSEVETRKLHHSPGLSQTHRLRYTMGYREDCKSCQSKSRAHTWASSLGFLDTN
jgi:hypothetical protein